MRSGLHHVKINALEKIHSLPLDGATGFLTDSTWTADGTVYLSHRMTKMSFTSTIATGFRQNGVRLPARGTKVLFMRQCRADGLLTSTIMLSNYRLRVAQGPLTSRSFSLWPSWRTTTQPLPPTPPPPPSETSESVKLDSSDITPTSSSVAEPVVPADNVASVDPLVTSEVDPVPEAASTLTDIVQNIPPPPLQFGDFSAMGLTGISPAGIIRSSFEIINVTSGMPWFWTIVAGSVFWRLVCVPLTLKAARTAAIMQPHQKELAALQERVKQSASTQNALELMKANRALKEFYQKLGISPLGGVLGLLQVPVTLGMFFAVKKMCDLPVEHLKFSGFGMYPDLTVVDPTMTLPIVMTAAVNLQLLISARDIAPNLRPMLYFFHFLTVPGFFFLKDFPVALLISILTTALLTMTQTVLLRVPAIRTALRMPLHVPSPDQGHPLINKLKSLLFKNSNLKEEVAHARRQQVSRRRNMP